MRVLLVRKVEDRVNVNKPQTFQELKGSISRETAYLRDKIPFSEITRPA